MQRHLAFLIVIQALCLAGPVFALDKDDPRQTSPENLRGVAGSEMSQGMGRCQQEDAACARGCNQSNTPYSCRQSCRSAYVACSDGLGPPDKYDPKLVGKFDRAVKACEAYRKAALRVESVAKATRMILEEITRLSASPNPADRAAAAQMLATLRDKLEAEYEDGAEAAVAAERNYAQFLLLTGTSDPRGRSLAGASGAGPGGASAKAQCDQVIKAGSTPELRSYLSELGVNEPRFDELLAAGNAEKAVDLVEDALAEKLPQRSLTPEGELRVAQFVADNGLDWDELLTKPYEKPKKRP